MRLALGEDGDQHVGARDLLAARRLDVDVGALDDPLEAGGRLGVVAPVGHEVLELVLDVVDDLLLQHVDVHRTGLEHGGGVGVVGQREQQVLQRRVFMVPVVGQRQGAVQGLFE